MDAVVFFAFVVVLSILGAQLGTDSRPRYDDPDAWSVLANGHHH